MNGHITVGGGHNQGMSYSSSSFSSRSSSSRVGNVVVGGGHLDGPVNRAPEHTSKPTLTSRDLKPIKSNIKSNDSPYTPMTPQDLKNCLKKIVKLEMEIQRGQDKKILNQNALEYQEKDFSMKSFLKHVKNEDPGHGTSWWHTFKDDHAGIVDGVTEGLLSAGSALAGDVGGAIEHGLSSAENFSREIIPFVGENWQHVLRDPHQPLTDWDPNAGWSGCGDYFKHYPKNN